MAVSYQLPMTTARLAYPAEPAAATTEQLLRRYHNLPSGHPDRARLRARAIEENLPMANRLARRYAGRGELLDDLAQVAALALVRAVDGYDPRRQVPFAGYAIPCILGALKRHFRDSAWAIRVPRSTRQLANDMATAADKLGQKWGRPPTATELSDHLHASVDDLRAAVGASYVASLNEPLADADGTYLADVIGGIDPRYANVDDHLSLRPLLAALSQRERRILAMRFYGEMTQTAIAADVGLSQMHVSRLLNQSLDRLRTALAS